MHDNFELEPEVLKAKITQETARISWQDLQKFYASGAVLVVESSADLVAVAFAMATDQSAQVAQWLQNGTLAKVNEAQALCWYENQQELWAVVVSPWVLVQLEKKQLQ